ncbi:MAG TPA: diguanylate cyclase [Gemmatimonadales bacterium]|nr:diguanylate cyclase [Gemmatimonadales bacterium]
MTNGSRVLLAGDAAARPAGLERALTRAGFILTEAGPSTGPEPDAVLVTVASAGESEMRSAMGEAGPASPPLVVLIAARDTDAPAAALALGADDALAAPVHLPELCARLHARIRDRQYPRGTVREGAVRRALEGLVSDGRLTLRPDEVVLALVRRLARAFDLRSCSFLAVEPDGATRIVAEAGQDVASTERAGSVEPTEYPEILEAIRGRRPVARPGGAVTAVPAVAEATVHGVLVLRQRPDDRALSPAQLQFAETLAETAARTLASASGGGSGNGTPPSRVAAAEDMLGHRLQEEFERARRYSLSFSLVLLEIRPPQGAAIAGPETTQRLRQGLRLPDIVFPYGGGEFAIVLPETGAEGARRSVARVREQLAQGPTNGGSADPPLSAGIVTYPHPAVAQVDDLFALVEAALARGKAQTGERVGVAD